MRAAKLLPILGVLMALIAASCQTIDDDRIPVAPVNIVFNTVADWNIYGVAGAMDSREFIRDLRRPANYPYTALTYTGFGGVLLVSDVMGEPLAYDLACPVEADKNVRVAIDTEDQMLARCPKCGSTYNVFSLQGHPVSGPAVNLAYGLRRYHVAPGRNASAYMVVSF